MVFLHAVVAIILAVLAIGVFRLSPAAGLVIGSLYLGLAAGLGPEDTLDAITTGFGDVMSDIGLVIVFGTFVGSLLLVTGAVQKLVDRLVKTFGLRGLPYAFGLSCSTFFTPVYADVMLVVLSPLARIAGRRLNRGGIASLGAAVSMGLLVGLVFVIPGVGALAAAGLLDIPLGTMLIYGLPVAVLTVIFTTAIYNFLLAHGLWNDDKDEDSAEAEQRTAVVTPGDEHNKVGVNGRYEDEQDSTFGATRQEERDLPERDTPPLYVSLLPLVTALVLIALGAIAAAADLKSGIIVFFGNPTLVLFLAFLGSYLLAWRTISAEHARNAITISFRESGQILVLTGLGGSFAAVIGKTELGDTLSGLFSTNALSPLILAWLIAAVLDVAIGSTTTSLIAAAGILAPVVGGLGVPTVLIALAAGSGALFAPHINANFFWMCKGLLGLSTQGTFKTYTVARTIASVVSLLLILALGLFL